MISLDLLGVRMRGSVYAPIPPVFGTMVVVKSALMILGWRERKEKIAVC